MSLNLTKKSFYVTLVFSGVPNKGDKIRSGDITPVVSVPENGGNGYITPRSRVPNKGTKSEVAI